MSSQQSSQFSVERYVVIHVATTCDEHGVYVTKDSAEVIELGWILLDANTLEEVRANQPLTHHSPHPGPVLTLPILDHTRKCSRQACQHSYYASVQYVYSRLEPLFRLSPRCSTRRPRTVAT